MVVTTRTIPAESGWAGSQHLCLLSDLHIGAAECDMAAIRRDLEEARRLDARILINGDVFDAILPGDRKRFRPEVLAPELRGRSDILNGAVHMAFRLLEPFADFIDVIGVGNHEGAVEKIHSLDPVTLLIGALHSKGHTHVAHGGYEGYYRIRLQPGHRRGRSGTTWTFTLRYHHGYGGGAAMTGNVLPLKRLSAWTPDADVVWLGHKHVRQVDDSQCRERITSDGRVRYEPVLLVSTGSYLHSRSRQTSDEILAGGRRSNYAAESGCPPLQLGGLMLECRWNGDRGKRVRVTSL